LTAARDFSPLQVENGAGAHAAS